jgi:hypothetical protein
MCVKHDILRIWEENILQTSQNKVLKEAPGTKNEACEVFWIGHLVPYYEGSEIKEATIGCSRG